ncbi:hypothetical protein F2P81_024311 [Scophthalmus maximus]|uniref:Uncharacterized protein n=1 Tax=Scophthalmus maximus TaxID=52904 RepID=A0A6A4RX77_SCOMX|nr:hypothetical protein F2P81_024311 [Scophthalmus maximus]
MCVNHADPKRWKKKSVCTKSSCGRMSTGLTAERCGRYSQILDVLGEPERKCLAYDAVDSSISLQVTTYTRVRLPYIRCPNLVGGANTRVRLNGRKQRRPGSLRRWVLNSELQARQSQTKKDQGHSGQRRCDYSDVRRRAVLQEEGEMTVRSEMSAAG